MIWSAVPLFLPSKRFIPKVFVKAFVLPYYEAIPDGLHSK